MYFLGLLATFKNEGMIIREWIEHYRWQGVEHIYLINNGSTDDFYAKIKPFVDGGYVTLYDMPDRYQQVKNYNEVFNKYIKKECKWLAILDLDEYLFATSKDQSIRSIVQSADERGYNIIQTNWLMFGSSGHEKQPDNIRASFFMRRAQFSPPVKSVCKTAHTVGLTCHEHKLSNSVPRKLLVENDALHLNHYAIMSKEYFGKVKIPRGDATSKNTNTIRTWEYFKAYDHKEFEDHLLANLLSASAS
jgi:hypothetical protein